MQGRKNKRAAERGTSLSLSPLAALTRSRQSGQSCSAFTGVANVTHACTQEGGGGSLHQQPAEVSAVMLAHQQHAEACHMLVSDSLQVGAEAAERISPPSSSHKTAKGDRVSRKQQTHLQRPPQ
jgi:hypothetical protein